MDKVRFGIIGYGRMGSQHAHSFMEGKIKNGVLTAVADIDPKRLEIAKETLGDGIKRFDSAEALLDSGLVDAVIPTVPHYYHPTYGIMAMKKGINFLCEKPAGVYAEQVERMNQVAKESGVVFGVMFNQRTNPIYQKAKDLVESGELGRIIHAHWLITSWFRAESYYKSSSWRATWKGEGGGLLLNQNPHNLDLFQWILGYPKRVKAELYYGKHRSIEVEDDVYALFEFPGGATASYITTISDAPGTNRFEIDGTRGRLVIENDALMFNRLRVDSDEFNKTFKGEIGQPENWKVEIPVKGNYTSHPGIIMNFADAILKGTKLIAPGEDGIKGLEISNGIHLSSWLGGIWVDLPADKELFKEELKKKCGGVLTQ